MAITTKIVVLDIDGVLNTHEPLCEQALCGKIHPDKIQLLKWILLKTEAKIVLSSAWRYIVHRGEMDLTGLNWLFRSHGLPAGSIIGITRPDTLERSAWDGTTFWPVNDERGQQIYDWRKENNHSAPYVVVDDLDLGISAAGHPFVQTQSNVGLTEEHATRIIKLLNQ